MHSIFSLFTSAFSLKLLGNKARALFISLLATLTVAFVPASLAQNKNELPEIGNAGFTTLSIEKERQFGDLMMRNTRATQPIINDPVIIEYINDLGNRMVRNAKGVNYSFEFFVVRNPELNAYAFFGGHIGIHSGLITRAENESELASVIGHEISHVTLRHLARSMEDRSKTSALSIAGMVSGILLALVDPNAGMAALMTTQAATAQSAINYTRSNEKEADRVGIELLANSGFDPQAAPSFFSKMAAEYRYASKPPAILLTHPVPESRVADARYRAQNYPPRILPPSLPFELTKARLRARYSSNSKDNIIQFQSEIDRKDYLLREAALYGLAISYLDNKNYDKAKLILEDLLAEDNKNLFYIDALADVYISMKAFKTGKEMLERLNLFMPNNPVVTLNYANLAISAKDYKFAEDLLKDFIIVHPENFLAYELLTDLYKKQEKQLEYHLYRAEIYAQLAGYQKAVDELQTAYNFSKEQPLMKKRIKAKILQYQDAESRLKRLIGKSFNGFAPYKLPKH